jgi:uncharacterized protein YjbI with pentapeptide repeats
MANKEHVGKLGEGADAWNQWRKDQAITPDLSGADFSSKDLSGAWLQDSDLSRANLRGADLRDATLDRVNLSGASLREANLQVVDLSVALSVAQRGLQTEQLAGADLTGTHRSQGGDHPLANWQQRYPRLGQAYSNSSLVGL